MISGTGISGQRFDLAGNVTLNANGAGVYLNQVRDGGGNVTNVTGNGGAADPIFSNTTYTPFNAPATRILGNGLTETRAYDNRERVTSISQAKSGSTVGYSVTEGYYPNGNVMSVNDSVNGSWAYTYDPLNRLSTASLSTRLNLGWTYDSFGNRLSQSATGTGSAPQVSLTFTGNNNRADASSGISYDAAGNVTVDKLEQIYTYDAEERISSVQSTLGGSIVYKYDSEGQLVYESGASGTQIFERNAAEQPIFIFWPTGGSGPYHDYISYIDGELIGSAHLSFL